MYYDEANPLSKRKEDQLVLANMSDPRHDSAQVTNKVAKCEICGKIRSILCGSSLVGGLPLGSGIEILQGDARCDRHKKLIISALGLDMIKPPEMLPMIIKDIRSLHVIKSPLNSATVIVPEMSSESSHRSLLTSALYLARDACQPEDLGIGKLLDSKWINEDQLSTWKSACAKRHGGLCKGFPNPVLSSIRPIWLVDVQRQCLVKAPRNSSYVALSYVWGSQVTLNTTRHNLRQLQKERSLTQHLPNPIARTIQDAMGVVGLLSERYLWVDTLCIVQDDGPTKRTEISKMAMIYANASITIVAVQGEHANSGLRGLRGISEPRRLHQSMHVLDDKSKVIATRVGSSRFEAGTDNAVWATRGWTFQEQYFSRRRIFFDGDSVRWECACAIWREHAQLPSHLDRTIAGVIGCETLEQPQIPNLGSISSTLQDYSRREFTFPEDCLNAFEGISVVLSPQMAGRFVSGLPSSLFDVALLWQPGGRITRRTAKSPMKTHCLPSWSWAGWSGEIRFPDSFGTGFIRLSPEQQKSIPGVTRTLRWKFHKTKHSSGRKIYASILECKDKWVSGRLRSAPGWSKNIVKAPTTHREPSRPNGTSLYTHFYTHEAHAGYEFWYPIPVMGQEKARPSILAPYISCQSRRAWLFPDKKPWQTVSGYPVFSIRDKDGAWVGILQPHDGLNASGTAIDRDDEVELVEIAGGYCWDAADVWSGILDVRHPEKPKRGPYYEYYWVMWIEWTNGVAYRKGLGRVFKDCWEEQRGEPFNLLLG